MKAVIVYQSLYGNTHAIPEKGLVPVAAAGGPGLRACFESPNKASGKAAAFDTRLEGNKLLTGYASKGSPNACASMDLSWSPSRPAS